MFNSLPKNIEIYGFSNQVNHSTFSITSNMFFYFLMDLRVTNNRVIWELPLSEWTYVAHEREYIGQKLLWLVLEKRMNWGEGASKQWLLYTPNSLSLHLRVTVLKLCRRNDIFPLEFFAFPRRISRFAFYRQVPLGEKVCVELKDLLNVWPNG